MRCIVQRSIISTDKLLGSVVSIKQKQKGVNDYNIKLSNTHIDVKFSFIAYRGVTTVHVREGKRGFIDLFVWSHNSRRMTGDSSHEWMIELDEWASTQEFPLEKLHEGGIDLESFGQKGGINRGRGSKQGLGDLLGSWKLAAQCSDGHCVAIAHVLLEVHQTFGEHEHVSLLKRFAEQFIGSGDKADWESTLDDHQDFCGPRMSVRGIKAERSSEINPSHGDSQGV